MFDDIVDGNKKKQSNLKSQSGKVAAGSGTVASGTGVDSKKMPSLKLKKSQAQPVVRDTNSNAFSSPECALAKVADLV